MIEYRLFQLLGFFVVRKKKEVSLDSGTIKVQKY